MQLHLVPHKMSARHFETGEWETLSIDTHAYYIWQRPAAECYYIETGCEPVWADLHDFDRFEPLENFKQLGDKS